MIVAKKIAVASELEDYNILQVRGVIDRPHPPYYVPLIYLISCSEQRGDRSPGESHGHSMVGII